ncbi:MAG: LysM peptidoglycan-binding domain-containing protein [Gammaproteobacteria bacterium]|nr:LysM peptidoglycan-binding domain-containing protein [Gammaproteobacteria bacterium]NND58879.1 LysM peptidoglycan-binding domain-containing protein [Gammaproteobacteria bacterium]
MPNPIFVRAALVGLISLTSACSMMNRKADVSVVGNEADAEVAYVQPVYDTTVAETEVVQYAQARAAVPLAPGAPERYTVKRGDTLWDISGLFLDDPWLWPEIWYVNPQIDNPHLIYPGDVLRLVWVDGQPRIMLERDMVLTGTDSRMSPQVRYESIDEAITTIPYDVIAAFLSKPTVLDKKTVRKSPYIFDIRESHLMAGSGFHVYVRGTDAPAGTRYRIYHVGDPLRDPDSGKLFGYEGLYVGEGRITDEGDPATMFLTESKREALMGDRLILDDPALPLNFFPSAPERQVEGRIMHVVDGVSLIGSYQIVSINLGASDGMKPGHVLSVYSTGEKKRDRFASTSLGGIFAPTVRLPDEYSGEMMVFDVHDDLSFGLIMRATNEIEVLDTVRNP